MTKNDRKEILLLQNSCCKKNIYLIFRYIKENRLYMLYDKEKIMNGKLERYIAGIKSGELIQPGLICSMCDMDMITFYERFDELTEKGIVSPVLRIICPYCHSQDTKWYNVLADLPEIYTCPICGENTDAVRHAVVMYVKN